MLKVINTAGEHRRAFQSIEARREAKPGTDDHDALQVLALLVEDYERRAFPMEALIPRGPIARELERCGPSSWFREPLPGPGIGVCLMSRTCHADYTYRS